MTILEVQNLKKIYTTRFGSNQVQALSDVCFSVERGEYVAIMGESGSGKTTLLNILAALDKPTNGEVILDGKKLSPSLHVDLELQPTEVDGNLISDIERLQPFGAANPNPVFVLNNLTLLQKKLIL